MKVRRKGLAPGNYESGGKKLASTTRKGNRVLRTILVQAAHALARTKTYLAAQFRLVGAGVKNVLLLFKNFSHMVFLDLHQSFIFKSGG